MNSKFIKAVQALESATGMQWDDYSWLDAGNSVFAVYDCDPDTSDGLMFTIAGNVSPAWAEHLNGCDLDTVAAAALKAGAVTADELKAIMSFFTEGGE